MAESDWDPAWQGLAASSEGDANQPEELNQWRKGPYGWLARCPRPGPYLVYIRKLAAVWNHFQILADFMDVGTTAFRWISRTPGGYAEEIERKKREQMDRMARTRVCLLEFPSQGQEVKSIRLHEAAELEKVLAQSSRSSRVTFRLFVVEDLSRSVIEALGARYDVDPAFFLDHATVESASGDMGDWWRIPPIPNIESAKQAWFHIRYMRARCFPDLEALKEAEKQINDFNVFRRVDYDFNTSEIWDIGRDSSGNKHEAHVGLIRARATFWSGRDKNHVDQDTQLGQRDTPDVGILLLDPTIKAGNPLWIKTRNWAIVPPIQEAEYKEGKVPPSDNMFEAFLHWATRPSAFSFLGVTVDHLRSAAAADFAKSVVLHLVCTEWLTLLDYVKTRLDQILRESGLPILEDNGENFEQFLKAIEKLVRWHCREVPILREMVKEAIRDLFDQTDSDSQRQLFQSVNSKAVASSGPSSQDYRQDLQRVLVTLEEIQKQIDAIMGRVSTSVAALQHKRRESGDSYNLVLLLVLAALWFPLSFVRNMVWMTTDSLRLWPAAALPLFLVLMGLYLLGPKGLFRQITRKPVSDYYTGDR